MNSNRDSVTNVEICWKGKGEFKLNTLLLLYVKKINEHTQSQRFVNASMLCLTWEHTVCVGFNTPSVCCITLGLNQKLICFWSYNSVLITLSWNKYFIYSQVKKTQQRRWHSLNLIVSERKIKQCKMKTTWLCFKHIRRWDIGLFHLQVSRSLMSKGTSLQCRN